MLDSLRAPLVLSRRRVWAAYVVAVAADALQLLLGPIGWAFGDEAIDVIAMLAESAIVGFHPLLLPTFVLELFPVADMLPSWTACVALVIALHRRAHRDPPPPVDGPVIDV